MGESVTVNVLGVVVPLKYASLVVVSVQTSVMVLLLRASRDVDEETPLYFTSTAVFLSECIKLVICLALVFFSTPNTAPAYLPGSKKSRAHPPGLTQQIANYKALLHHEFIVKYWDTLKTAVPACTYVVQNNLLFLALSYIDAPTYQVTYQLKILTTAVCSVFILGRSLNTTKWLSLVMLTLGVCLVQVSSQWDNEAEASEAGEAVVQDGDSEGPLVSASGQLFGLLCVVSACFFSGFSGVYFEKVLKTSKCSIWVRNVQLSMFSLLPALLAAATTDYAAIMEHGPLYGCDRPIVWLTILCQASSGLVVAVAVKYADNILKGFATSISIIISSAITMVLFGFHPHFYWLCGTVLVMISTLIYSGTLGTLFAPRPRSLTSHV